MVPRAVASGAAARFDARCRRSACAQLHCAPRALAPAAFPLCRTRFYRIKASSRGKVPQGPLVQAKLDEDDLSSEVPAENLDEAALLAGPGKLVCRVAPRARGGAACVCRRGG
jgi:hypothetical protein